MSKIEEALEKANKLREFEIDHKKLKQNVSKKNDLTGIENEYVITANQPDSPISEEYRRLKSMVIRETKPNFLNTIMITSSMDGEGKTLTAINLAISLSQEIDHTILLVDADFRRPMIHNYLGMRNNYGLSDYLSGDVDLSEILLKTDIGNLVFLPAGKSVENPAELLSSEKMQGLITEFKTRYVNRYVIIDTPPILSFAESISLGSYVDSVIFVIMERFVKKKAVENALSLIKDLNVLGIVFNKVSMTNLNGQSYRYNS